MKHLKKQQLISPFCEEILNQTVSGIPLELMKRLNDGNSLKKGCRYPPELKSFALTLQFYSAKAYEFVRRTFKLCLPHQSQIRKWYTKIPADPGFTETAFIALKEKADSAIKEGRPLVCSLMLDEMATRKYVCWNGKKFQGYVDTGNRADDDSLPVAKEALVFMVVYINASWKVPRGYFFIDGFSGPERANLVTICIQRLSESGIKIISVTCDGPSCHFSKLSALGASLHPPELHTSFPQPIFENEKVYAILDACHMLKLMRNTFAEYGVLIDQDNRKISWQYVVELQKLQETEGLRLGNKLKLSHIQWHHQKMKVNLAAQVFSSSVAAALEYCANALKMKQFNGCDATVKFIRTIDRLFDILNSRNPFAKGFKSALRKANKAVWYPFLEVASNYILGLKSSTGQLMYQTRRKTAFIGFLIAIAIAIVRGIFMHLIEKAEAPLKYILTYKFSQDHLELFFGAIRSAGGFNKNPTTQQFTAAYKRLLLRSSIQVGNGNYQTKEQVDILHAISNTCYTNEKDTSISEASIIRKYDLSEMPLTADNHGEIDFPNIVHLSEFKVAAISYIPGFVAQTYLCCMLYCTWLDKYWNLGSRRSGT